MYVIFCMYSERILNGRMYHVPSAGSSNDSTVSVLGGGLSFLMRVESTSNKLTRY